MFPVPRRLLAILVELFIDWVMVFVPALTLSARAPACAIRGCHLICSFRNPERSEAVASSMLFNAQRGLSRCRHRKWKQRRAYRCPRAFRARRRTDQKLQFGMTGYRGCRAKPFGSTIRWIRWYDDRANRARDRGSQHSSPIALDSALPDPESEQRTVLRAEVAFDDIHPSRCSRDGVHRNSTARRLIRPVQKRVATSASENDDRFAPPSRRDQIPLRRRGLSHREAHDEKRCRLLATMFFSHSPATLRRDCCVSAKSLIVASPRRPWPSGTQSPTGQTRD